MSTRVVEWAPLPLHKGEQPARYEIRTEAVDFELAEAHVELGGVLVAMKDGAVYQVFDSQFGPTFIGLWTGCTFHMVVKEIPRDAN